MDEPKVHSDEKKERLIKTRKRAGRIMSGLAIIGLIFIILILIAFFMFPPDSGFSGLSMIITGPLLLIFAGLAIFFVLVQINVGNLMYKGQRRRYVKGWITVFLVLAVIDLVLTIIEGAYSGFNDSFGALIGALISLAFFGYLYDVIKRTWDTFEPESTSQTPPNGQVGITYPTKEYVPRKIREKRIIYTKEYTRELEAERKRVRNAHEELVPAGDYDFGTISSKSTEKQ